RDVGGVNCGDVALDRIEKVNSEAPLRVEAAHVGSVQLGTESWLCLAGACGQRTRVRATAGEIFAKATEATRVVGLGVAVGSCDRELPRMFTTADVWKS